VLIHPTFHSALLYLRLPPIIHNNLEKVIDKRTGVIKSGVHKKTDYGRFVTWVEKKLMETSMAMVNKIVLLQTKG
jgi:hypothetical protein